MSQSVKFSDGSYLDATDVWDTTQEKTQQQQNADVQDAVNNLNTSVSGLNTSVNSLNSSVSSLNSSVNSLNSYKPWLTLASTGTGYWHNSFTSGLKVFYYGGKSTTTYKIPVSYCFVIVARSSNRGAALAIQWNGGTSGITYAWLNRLHDDTGSCNWSGWTKISTASSTV